MRKTYQASCSRTSSASHLMIPMEFDPARYPVKDGVVAYEGNEIGWIDPRALDDDGVLLSPYELEQREGVLAWPERFPPEVVETLKIELGPYGFAGQYQQSRFLGRAQSSI